MTLGTRDGSESVVVSALGRRLLHRRHLDQSEPSRKLRDACAETRRLTKLKLEILGKRAWRSRPVA